MAFTVYPSENDVAATPNGGRVGSEVRHKGYAELWLENHVKSGFALSAGAGLDVDIATGEAVISGRRLESDAIVNRAGLTPSTTNFIFLQYTLDGSSNVTAVNAIFNTTDVLPTNAIRIGEAVTDGANVTSVLDVPYLSPYQFVDSNVGMRALDMFIAQGAFGILPTLNPTPKIPIAVPVGARFVNVAMNVFSGRGTPVGGSDYQLALEGSNRINRGTAITVAHDTTVVIVLSVKVSGLTRFTPGNYLKLFVEGGQTVTVGDGAFMQDGDWVAAPPIRLAVNIIAPAIIDSVKWYSRVAFTP